MSISAPLSSTASSSHPFFLTIALQGPSEAGGKDASESTPLDPTRTAHAATNGSAVDVFDEIDSATSPWTIENSLEPPQRGNPVDLSGKGSDSKQATTSNAPTEPSRDAVFDCALSDTHSLLYGNAAGPPGCVQDSGRRDAIQEEDGLPEWMKETSGRVTSMSGGHLRSEAGQDGDGSPTRQGQPRRQRQRRPSFRLAVGSEDGNVWIFAHPHAAGETEVPRTRGTETSQQENDAAALLVTAAPSLAVATSTDAHGESSRAGSSAALDSLSPTRVSNAQHRPLRSHRSSGSITTLSSLTSPSSVRSRRIVSASSSSSSAAAAAATTTTTTTFGLREPSHSSASLQSFDFARVHPRPRKASATVSISTSPAEPSTACHSRARTPAPTGAGFAAGDGSDLPPLQTSSSPPGSPPVSPTSMSSIPSVLVIPTSPYEGEKEEATPASRSHRRTGSRAKDSIAAGIGLWEPDFEFPSATASGDATPRNGSESESEPSGHATDTKKVSVDSSAQSMSDSRKLEPILQIVTRGFGAVVELRIVEDLRSADPEEGIALVVLRESG